MKEKEYFKVPYISNSALSWFKISPLYCFKRMQGEIEDEQKSYFTTGKQIHMALLEPERFKKIYTVLDAETPRSGAQKSFCDTYLSQIRLGVDEKEASLIAFEENYSAKNKSENAIAKDIDKLLNNLEEYISYLKAKEEYVEVLNKSKFELIQSVISTVKKHKKANTLFDNTFKDVIANNTEIFNELIVFWDYPKLVNEEPIKCKSMIDRLIIDHDNKKITLIDFKTSSKLGKFKEEFELFEYYRQLSFYWMAINSHFSKYTDYEKETYIVVCSTVEPHECKVLNISDEYLNEGTKEIVRLMDEISWHYFTGHWDHSKEYYEGDGTETL